jgi:hypothetical protein
MGDYLNTTWIIFSVYGGSRTYDNANFVQAFNQSFINVILSLDPNKKFDPTDRTLPWRNWSSDHMEMLFNETAAGDPDMRAVSTDPRLLARCEYVTLSPWLASHDTNFYLFIGFGIV